MKNKKFNQEQIEEIKRLFNNKEKTIIELSKMYGVTRRTIYNYVSKDSYKEAYQEAFKPKLKLWDKMKRHFKI